MHTIIFKIYVLLHQSAYVNACLDLRRSQLPYPQLRTATNPDTMDDRPPPYSEGPNSPPPPYDKGQEQLDLISEWLDDKLDRWHPRPARFFESHDWDRDILQKAFLETLYVVIEDLQRPAQRVILRLHGEPWHMPIEWGHVEYSRETHEKRRWSRIWFHQAIVDEWDEAKLIEHFILLREEQYFLENCRDKFENYERYLQAEAAQGRVWAYQAPTGFIPRRPGDVD